MTPQEQFDAAEAMLKDNLATACAELLELGSACILKDGVIRKAAALITCLPLGGHLKTVENTVKDLALRFVVDVDKTEKEREWEMRK